MRPSAGTRSNPRDVFERLLGWMDQLRHDGKYPFGLEEEVLVVERVVQDLGDSALSEVTLRQLKWWAHATRTRSRS